MEVDVEYEYQDGVYQGVPRVLFDVADAPLFPLYEALHTAMGVSRGRVLFHQCWEGVDHREASVALCSSRAGIDSEIQACMSQCEDCDHALIVKDRIGTVRVHQLQPAPNVMQIKYSLRFRVRLRSSITSICARERFILYDMSTFRHLHWDWCCLSVKGGGGSAETVIVEHFHREGEKIEAGNELEKLRTLLPREAFEGHWEAMMAWRPSVAEEYAAMVTASAWTNLWRQMCEVGEIAETLAYPLVSTFTKATRILESVAPAVYILMKRVLARHEQVHAAWWASSKCTANGHYLAPAYSHRDLFEDADDALVRLMVKASSHFTSMLDTLVTKSKQERLAHELEMRKEPATTYTNEREKLLWACRHSKLLNMLPQELRKLVAQWLPPSLCGMLWSVVCSHDSFILVFHLHS